MSAGHSEMTRRASIEVKAQPLLEGGSTWR